jgi:hypothetical protein
MDPLQLQRTCRLCAEPIAVEEDAYLYQVRKVLTTGERHQVEGRPDEWEHAVCADR